MRFVGRDDGVADDAQFIEYLAVTLPLTHFTYTSLSAQRYSQSNVTSEFSHPLNLTRIAVSCLPLTVV